MQPAPELRIERVPEATDELRQAVARLLPQLSSSAAAPDLATLDDIAKAPGTYLLVARDPTRDRRIVGSLTLVTYRIPTGLRAVVEDVVVDEAARGRGVGEALVEEALRLAREQGARQVDLTSRPARQAANRLYERLGFERRETNVYRRTLEVPTEGS